MTSRINCFAPKLLAKYESNVTFLSKGLKVSCTLVVAESTILN